MLDASDVVVVLDQLERAGLVVWLDGGWGVDALLGYRGRPHRTWTWSSPATTARQHNTPYPAWGSNLT
jgi:hypothetical protein